MGHLTQQRNSNKIDPDFAIPVSIRVTDVNDNAPSFLGAPYTLNISGVQFNRMRFRERELGTNSVLGSCKLRHVSKLQTRLGTGSGTSSKCLLNCTPELSLVGATVFRGVEAVDRDQPGESSLT